MATEFTIGSQVYILLKGRDKILGEIVQIYNGPNNVQPLYRVRYRSHSDVFTSGWYTADKLGLLYQ